MIAKQKKKFWLILITLALTQKPQLVYLGRLELI